jgi:SOS-response transcriptional repressor LexA
LPDPRALDLDRFIKYWRTNPIDAWAKGRDRRWFAVEGDKFIPKLPCAPGDESTLAAMTWELCDYRLAMYRNRQKHDANGASFSAKVLWNQRDPILKLPSRKTTPELPKDDIDVRLPSGDVWRFRFAKEFCNVAHPVGSQRNQLPDLLRRWFGISAGRPGTAFYVRFTRSSDGLWVEPESAEGVRASTLGTLVAFPTLRAAAGATANPVELPPESESVRLPTAAQGEGLFAVRAEGDSMDGGKRPIRDGDWLVMRFARSASYSALDGKVALLQIPDPHLGFSYQVKRLVRDGETWVLRSDNPARPSFGATDQTVPIAILVDIVRPEDIGPRPGERLDDAAAASAFGVEGPLHTGRAGGHLFFCIEAAGALVAPDRISVSMLDRRPGETAYVLARPPGEAAWQYLGVARYREEEGLWACRGIDFAIYRALGSGRGASRSLPPVARERARTVVDWLLSGPSAGAFVERNDKRCRIVGGAENGGLRIDGGPGGFAERTVTLTDIAWVLIARDDVRKNGGLLNEERVNHLRYLDGTPKGSTRWIDTGWALLLVASAGSVGERQES